MSDNSRHSLLARFLGGLLRQREDVFIIVATILLGLGTNVLAGLSVLSLKKPFEYVDVIRFCMGGWLLWFGWLLMSASSTNRYVQERIRESTGRDDSPFSKFDAQRRAIEDSLKTSQTLKLLARLRTALFSGTVIVVSWLTVGYLHYAGYITWFDIKQGTGIASPKQGFVVGYQELSLYRHMFTAKEKGFFGDEGLNVELKPFVSANLLADALLSGQIQATGLTNLQVGLTIEQKQPGEIVFGQFLVWGPKAFPDYIIVPVNSAITSISQLRGKTLGLHPGSAVRAFARTVLEKSGVQSNEVKSLELEPAIMQSALIAGRVDALYCMDPVATNLVASGQGKILLANPMSEVFAAPVPISAVAFRRRLMAERAEDVQGFLRAIDRSIRFMRLPGHEQEIAGFIAKYTKTTPQLILKENPSQFWTTDETDPSRVQALADRFTDLHIITSGVHVQSMLLSAPVSPSATQKR
jgi:NitT/TauT family transport system substrate-binding protein